MSEPHSSQGDMNSEEARSARLEAILSAYYAVSPDPENPDQRVAFGTSGHRGASLSGSFNEAHILAITQAVCEYRKSQGISGPLFLGKDTHALSGPALTTALEVLAANQVDTRIQERDLPTPTPVVSHAIICHNVAAPSARADGIVVTPSHNPPEDGGFKYNEYHGGPAGAEVTAWIEKRANALLADGNRAVARLADPMGSGHIKTMDYVMPYVLDLKNVVNMEIIAESGLQLGADPLGGASLPFWEPIAEHYGLALSVVNDTLDPLFSFMPPDHDGKIRMDCSSPYAMAGLIAHSQYYDLSFGNDPDADRHGIVTPSGLMNPNDYLCAVVWFLLQHRPEWPQGAKVGKTLVSSSLLDKICMSLGREVLETPVGFKWFVPGLADASLVFGGEESAGASFLRRNGTTWTTDKDGIILDLLAAEMTAVLGRNPAEIYAGLTGLYGRPFYARLDAPATPAQKNALKKLTPGDIHSKELAGSPITGVLTQAPGNHEAIGGIKVVTDQGWFAARPSGTEDLYKIYAESFVSQGHLNQLQEEARELVDQAFS